MENDLKFAGASPVIIDQNGSTDEIYAPISTSSSDITIVSDHILDDLYTPDKDDIQVEISYDRALYYLVPESIIKDGEVEQTTGYAIDLGGSYRPPTYDPILRVEADDSHTFFVNKNGVLCYNGRVSDRIHTAGYTYNVRLYYDYEDEIWKKFESQQGSTGIEACSSSNSFYDSNHFYIKSGYTGRLWIDGDSTQEILSQWTDGTTTEILAWDDHSMKDIIHLNNGDIEYIGDSAPNQERYRWNSTTQIWEKKPNYTINGVQINSIDGRNHFICKSEYNRDVDVIMIYYQDEGWIAKMYPENGTLELFIKMPDVGFNSSNVFTDDRGNVYKFIGNTVYIYSFMNNGEWLEFAELPRHYTTCYEIPAHGNTKKKVVLYQRSPAVTLSDITPPKYKTRKEYTGQYLPVMKWQGYATPNMYSQEVTQNLDSIGVTAIDPISILKYVTVDHIFSDRGLLSYAEILGLVLSYVSTDDHDLSVLLVEDCVSYGGQYNGTNGLLDLRCQISNFWDESGKAMTAYDMIGEMLRPFCMRLTYDDHNRFILYNINNTTDSYRHFSYYNFLGDGTLKPTSYDLIYRNEIYELSEDFISHNVSTPTMEINNTYDKVTAVASTSTPDHSNTVFDLVNYSDRDMYDYGWLNVQTNKSKGYIKETRMITIRPGQSHPTTVIAPVTEDKWFYIWNGVYANPEYNLEPTTVGTNIDWYLNINKAYEYRDGTTGNPDGTGSILNFFGGANNPTATGKTQAKEKGVEIKKKITSYAPDNGTPLEFLETEDINWTYSYGGSIGGVLSKNNPNNVKFGTERSSSNSTRIVYHQEYKNVALSSIDDNVVNISLSKTFSRTGIDVPINIMSNNTATDKQWGAGGRLNSANSDYFPDCWNSTNVKVDSTYFIKYSTGGIGTSCRPVWDYIRVDLYVQLSDGTYLQFNGKDWVRDGGNHSLPFYLGKMITYQNLFHNEFRYNVIRSSADTSSFSDTPKYTLGDEDYVFYYDKKYGVSEKETKEYSKCPPLKDQGISWIADCSEGSLSIRLPYVDDPGAKVFIDIYNSALLGMTGMDSHLYGGTYGVGKETFYYATTDATTPTTPNFREIPTYIRFMPVNASYIKAEHLDLSVSISVSSSNLGQMFDESDIKYYLDSHKGYVEEYDIPDFKVNTKNSYVGQSYSYLMYNNSIADPGEFINNVVGARPEAYTVQAYYNWLTKIRKRYYKTIKYFDDLDENSKVKKGNTMLFLKSPEVSDNDLMVVADSWDLKTHRHSISAIEAQDLLVEDVEDVQADEIPRKARAERFNLPTAVTRRTVRS